MIIVSQAHFSKNDAISTFAVCAWTHRDEAMATQKMDGSFSPLNDARDGWFLQAFRCYPWECFAFLAPPTPTSLLDVTITQITSPPLLRFQLLH